MFYNNFINHRKKLHQILKMLKIYRKLQIKKVSNMLIDMKKIMLYCLKYSHLYIYLKMQIDLFMNPFALILDLKQVQRRVNLRHNL